MTKVVPDYRASYFQKWNFWVRKQSMPSRSVHVETKMQYFCEGTKATSTQHLFEVPSKQVLLTHFVAILKSSCLRLSSPKDNERLHCPILTNHISDYTETIVTISLLLCFMNIMPALYGLSYCIKWPIVATMCSANVAYFIFGVKCGNSNLITG